MKLLVTRPAADSAALAALLEAQGHEVLIDPMLEVKPIEGAAVDLDGVTGLLFSSANGVRAFAALSDRSDLVAYAVGDRTAEAARAAGFGQVESANGDVEALAKLVAERRKPEDGILLHVSGAVRAGTLAETLAALGFTVRHVALYEAVPAASLAPATIQAVTSGGLDGVLLFSPRTAKHFADLVAAAELAEPARRLQAWCLSQAVADALAPLPLAGLHIAAEPTQASLLKAIGGPAVLSGEPILSLGAGLATRRPAAAAARRGGRGWAAFAVIVLIGIGIGASWQQWLPLVAPLWEEERPAAPAASGALAPPALPPSLPPSPTRPAQTATSAPTATSGSPSPGSTAPPATTTPAPPTTESAAGPTALEQRVARLESALEQARAEAAAAAPKGSVAALQSQLEQVAQHLDELAARPIVDPKEVQDLGDQTKRLAAAVAQLGDRLAPLEARINQKATAIRNDRTLVLAMGQIRDALAGSGGFAAPVAVIQAVLPDDADLAGPLGVLQRHQNGVSSRAQLAEALARLPDQLAAPPPLAAGTGIWDRFTDQMNRLVTIRRVDDGGGAAKLPPGPDRLVALSTQALTAGDLPGAIQALRPADGPAAAIVKPWLDAAQTRLDCEQAAETLEAAAIRRLGAPGDGPTGSGAEQ
jgi:uroporphyrinogen-III synthase